MSSQPRKLKTQFGQDVRRWHDAQGFAALSEFVQFSYGTALPPSYVLHYQDEEKDMVTVASDADLDAAFKLAESEGRVLKIFVTPVKDSEKQESKIADEPVPPAPRGFVQMIREEPDFRAQFVAFVQAFLTAVRDDDTAPLQRVFGEALAAFPEIAQHPDVVQANAMILPMALIALQPYTVFLTAIDPTRVGAVVEKIVAMIPERPCASMFVPPHVMPPFMPPFMDPSMAEEMMRKLIGDDAPRGPRGPHGPCGPRWRARHCGGRRSRGPSGCRARRHPKGGCCARRGRFAPCAQPEPVIRIQPWSPYQSEVIKSDVSLADGAVILPKQVVIKTWTVKNTGAEDWPEGTVISYVGEPLNPLVNGASFPVEAVKAGEEADIAVVLEAPEEGGEYSCQWRLVAPEDQKFGQIMTATVVVAGPQPARIACPCGKSLIQAQARNVYAPDSRVRCDGCHTTVSGEELAYHCAGGRSRAHPNGWDLCLSCARKQMVEQGVVSSAAVFLDSDEQPPVAPQPVPEPEPEPEPQPVPQEEADELHKVLQESLKAAQEDEAKQEQAELAEDEQEEQEAQPQYPDWATMTADREVLKQFYEEYLAAMRAQDEAEQPPQQQQEQAEAVKPDDLPAEDKEQESEADAVVVDMDVEEPDASEVKPAVEAEPYKFAAQLARLKELNFEMEEDALKALLEQHGGRVDVVVHAMLGL